MRNRVVDDHEATLAAAGIVGIDQQLGCRGLDPFAEKALLRVVPAHAGKYDTDVHVAVGDGLVDVQIACGRLQDCFELEHCGGWPCGVPDELDPVALVSECGRCMPCGVSIHLRRLPAWTYTPADPQVVQSTCAPDGVARIDRIPS